MSVQAIRHQRQENSLTTNDGRTKTIIIWLKKIDKSKLSVSEFFASYNVPFSRSQYYLYRKRYREGGESGIRDKRIEGGNKKRHAEHEAFIAGCVASNPEVSPQWLQHTLAESYGCKLSLSGITRALHRLHPERRKRSRGRSKSEEQTKQHNSCGGFELIVALACHLGWPQMTAGVIKETIHSLQGTNAFISGEQDSDTKGRAQRGRFTPAYNQRKEVRETRFESITNKRSKKNWRSMNVIRDEIKTIERKSLAILSLPVVTMNGSIRPVNLALGQE